jgi:hypothetical protein
MNYEMIVNVAATLLFLWFLIMSVRAKELGYKALYLGWAAITLIATIADRVQP